MAVEPVRNDLPATVKPNKRRTVLPVEKVLISKHVSSV